MNSGRQMTRIKQMSVDFFNGLSMVIRPVCVIRILLIAPFLLTLGTVFVISNDLANGAVSGKYFWFYSSMGLASFTVTVAVSARKVSFHFSALDSLLLLFAGSIYLSALLFNEAKPNVEKLTLFTLLLVLYFSCRILSDVLKYRPIYRNLFYGFIVLAGLMEAIWGLWQLYGFAPSQHSLFKLTGSFFNPGPYAGYLAVVFPLALHSVFAHGKKYATTHTVWPEQILRWLSGIACVTILLVLPAAMSRASWIAVAAGSMVVICKKYPEFKRLQVKFAMTKQVKRTLKITAILFLLSAFTGMYFLKKDSADGRALTWKISLQTIVKHPFGVGLGNFSGAYGEEQAVYFASGNASKTEEYVAGNPEYGFNEYLQIAVESGILALLLFAGIIVFAIRSMIKGMDWGGLGSLVALLVFASFSYPFSLLPFLIVLSFLLASGQWHTDLKDLRGFFKNSPQRSICVNLLNLRHLRTIALVLCCLLVTVNCLYRQYPVYKAYRQWKNNQIYYQAGIFEDTAEVYGTLYPYLNERIQFLFDYAQSLSKAGLDEKQRFKTPVRCDSLLNKSNEVLCRAMQISCDPMLCNIMGKNWQAMKAYSEAEACFLRASRIVPNRVYPWYLLTRLYDEMGLKEKVRETADIVKTKEPKVQSPAVREMREEVEKLKIRN